jgi:uncharacterized membrane protein
MLAATLALLGLIVASYLSLWKIGVIGELACGVAGGCNTVQTSAYAEFLGVPVAFYGVGGYLALLGTSILGLQPRWASRREPTLALAVMSGIGVAFSAYLTYLEAAVINAWCRWCVVSAVIITAIFLVSLAGLRSAGRAASAVTAEPTVGARASGDPGR